MGANPDSQLPLPAGQVEVRRIGRDAIPSEQVVPLKPPARPAGASTGHRGRISWVVAALVLAAIAGTLWKTHSGSTGGSAVGVQQPVPLVSVASPGLTSVTSTITFTGTIAARYDMPIGIEGDAGRIVGVYVEAGDHVKRGQLLAKIDESVWQPQVNRLEASLEQARAQAALSEAEYRRAMAVKAAGALSAEDIEKRRATSVTDAASVKVAEALLAEARARLERTRVLAPTDGVVLTRRAEVGQTASPGGEPLFRLAAGDEIEMRGQVAEQDMAALQVGQPAQVHLVGNAEPFDGRVRLLGAVIDPLTRLGDIRIALGHNPALRPGAFARASVATNTAERPVLPQTAVMSDLKGPYVYIVNAANKVERRDVKVGGTIASGVIVSGGLRGDERIVTTAAGFLREGEVVTPTSVQEAPASAASATVHPAVVPGPAPATH